ncbi:MAG: hypothetical protein NT045_08000 [Candidatus Aureabacteria bacterium]|nr:hypothetical protein [Candidatus Auribacterota bacterium]
MTPSARVLLAALASCPPALLCADTITCKSGRVYEAVIVKESPAQLTINLYGATVVIPAGDIASIRRSSPDVNEQLQKGWEQAEAHFREESRKAEQEAEAAEPPPEPEPAATPYVPPDDGPGEEPAPVVFSAQPPAAPRAAPVQPGTTQQRLDWKRDVRQAVYTRSVIPGMTAKQVEKAWGWPDLIHPVHGVEDYTDRWIYQREDEGRAIVYFRNGRVVNVQEP